MKKIVSFLLVVLVVISMAATPAHADEAGNVRLTFDVSVPEGFENDVRILVENGTFSRECVISQSEQGYVGAVNVIGNSEYKLELEIIGEYDKDYNVIMQETVEIGKNGRMVGAAITIVEVYPLLGFNISVPEGFDKDIYVIAGNGEFSDDCTISKDSDGYYFGSVRVMGNSVCEIKLEILGAKENEYSIDMQEKVEIGDKAERVDVVITENPSFDSEEISKVEEREGQSAESVYSSFLEKTKHIENIDDEAYDYIFKYVSAREDLFLEDDDRNTSEEWDTMTDYDRFTYFYTVIRPRSSLINNEKKDNVESFIKEEFEVIQRFFENREIPADDAVVVAIQEVWEWLYHDYMENGSFCNLYRLEDKKSELDEIGNDVVSGNENPSKDDISEESEENKAGSGSETAEKPDETEVVGEQENTQNKEENKSEEDGEDISESEKAKKNSLVWILIGVLCVVVVGGISFVLVKKNKK